MVILRFIEFAAVFCFTTTFPNYPLIKCRLKVPPVGRNHLIHLNFKIPVRLANKLCCHLKFPGKIHHVRMVLAENTAGHAYQYETNQTTTVNMADSGVRKILFVCLGNICRSPTSEAILRHLVKEKGEEGKWEIDSAGTADYHTGNRPDKRTLQTLKKHGISTEHRARQVCPDDFNKFDIIFAFDESNVEDLEEERPKGGKAKVKLFGEYDPEGVKTVYDPYYGEIEEFDVMFDHCNRCCKAFLEQSR